MFKHVHLSYQQLAGRLFLFVDLIGSDGVHYLGFKLREFLLSGGSNLLCHVLVIVL